MARHRRMRLAVEHHVLVDFVRQHQDLRVLHDRHQGLEIGLAQDRAGRVVRCVDDDHARAQRDGGPHVGPLYAVAIGVQPHRHRHHDAARQRDGRRIAIVGRLDHDHLVARVHDGQDRRLDGLTGAGSDGDVGVRVVAMAVGSLDLGRNRPAQRRQAGHRRILVMAGAHRVGHQVDQRRVAREIGETLAQVDGAMVDGQLRHAGEHGGADVRQAGDQRWKAHECILIESSWGEALF